VHGFLSEELGKMSTAKERLNNEQKRSEKPSKAIFNVYCSLFAENCH